MSSILFDKILLYVIEISKLSYEALTYLINKLNDGHQFAEEIKFLDYFYARLVTSQKVPHNNEGNRSLI